MLVINYFSLAIISLYVWIPIVVLAVGALVFFIPKVIRFIPGFFYFLIKTFNLHEKMKTDKAEIAESLDEVIKTAGYAYDEHNDVFYSTINAWQRKMGYCRLYDEAAAPLGMIIDSEPFYFTYRGKKWLIEFWKGQYDLTMGCEVGVYTSEWPDLDVPGLFNGTFYECASEDDQLFFSFTLRKNGETVLKREGKHWWLTGFKLGEFAEPSELSMDIYITLKDKYMRDAFVKAIKDVGYSNNEYLVYGTTVAIKYDKPYSEQPKTRTDFTDKLIQKKNKFLCDKYQELTKDYVTLADKLNAVQTESPEIYSKAFNIGKTEHVFDAFKAIKKYLS